MYVKNLIPLSVLLGSVIAAPAPFNFHQHHHHQVKREADVVTVYVTQTQDAIPSEFTTVNSVVANDEVDFYAASVESVPATSSVADAISVATSSIETPTTSASSAEVASSSSIASVASSTAASSSSSDSAKASSTAAAGSAAYYAENAKGIAYSPYTDSGSCKDADTIQSDIKMLSAYDVIRVYAPDCSCIENILSAKTSSQQIFAGLYYADSLSTDIDTLATQVATSTESWDAIYAVAIGNEWVNGGTYSVSQVAAAVTSGRSLLSAAGFTGKVVTVDTLVAYQSNTELCEISDFIAVNSHPFWDGNTLAADSGSFLETQIGNIYSACGSSKSVLVCETGWPTAGDDYGVAVPSAENQIAALKSIAESSIVDQVLMFTTYNDYWKSAGTYGVEQSWGIYE